MRTSSVAIVVVLLVVASVRGGDNDLFDKFKRQNTQARERLQADIKGLLEKAQAIEKDEPAKALVMLQVTRDTMLAKGLLTAKEDRVVADPLFERIQALQAVIRVKQADELRGTVADYREYLSRMRDELANLKQAMVPPSKEAPPGGPAYIAFTNGTVAAGWISESPVFVVRATINDQEHIYGPGTVAGLQTPQGFFLYHNANKRFVPLATSDMFIVAVATHLPARRGSFWMPLDIPPPPQGFYKTSTGAVGAALFARSAAAMMTLWAGPGGTFPESVVGVGADASTRRLYRDVLIDLMVQEFFASAKRADRAQYRDAILAFLDRRGREDALNSEEVAQFSDLIADISPDRRSDAVAFTILLNRLLDQSARLRKK